eukprot:gene27275-48824_t
MVELVPRQHPRDHHFAIQTICEIIDGAARADMKSDVLKDIERHKQQLISYRGNPMISEQALNEAIAQLEDCFSQLSGLVGKTGQSLTENDWLMSIRSRIGIPAGTCEFDLPAYYKWQHHSAAERQAFAREQNRSACVFVDAGNAAGADGQGDADAQYVLDYFYPHMRSPLCLHATLAAARVRSSAGTKANSS